MNTESLSCGKHLIPSFILTLNTFIHINEKTFLLMTDLIWQLCKWMTTLSHYCCLLAKSCSTLCDPTDCSVAASLSFTISWSLLIGFSVFHYLLEFAQTHVHLVMLSNHLILCCSLLLLPSIFSNIIFQWVGSSHQVAKVWSFSFSISPSNEYSVLISFRIDWFDLLAVWGTLKSILH